MELLSTFHLKQWVKDNAQLFNPPFRTNQLLVHHKDFLVMMLRGPNTRLDFHIEPGDEFFYQVVYGEFNADPELRTCRACGYVFPETPMAERLSFLETKK